MSIEKYKEFCEHFEELDLHGIPYGLGDLLQKAKELGLKPCASATDFIKEMRKCHS